MTVAVIDRLEAIEVDQQQAEPGTLALVADEAGVSLFEAAAIEQAGQRIARSLGMRLRFGTLALGHIVDDALQHAGAALQRIEHHMQPAPASAGIAALEVRALQRPSAHRLAQHVAETAVGVFEACREQQSGPRLIAPGQLERACKPWIPVQQPAVAVNGEQAGLGILEDQPPLALGGGVQAAGTALLGERHAHVVDEFIDVAGEATNLVLAVARRGLDVLPADGIQPVQVVGQGADRAGDAAGDDPRHPQGDRHHLEGEDQRDQARVVRRFARNGGAGRQHLQAADDLGIIEWRMQRPDELPCVRAGKAPGGTPGFGQHPAVALDRRMGDAAIAQQAHDDLVGELLVSRERSDARRAIDGRHDLAQHAGQAVAFDALDQQRTAPRHQAADQPAEEQDQHRGAEREPAPARHGLRRADGKHGNGIRLRAQDGTGPLRADRAHRRRHSQRRCVRRAPRRALPRPTPAAAAAASARRTAGAPSRH